MHQISHHCVNDQPTEDWIQRHHESQGKKYDVVVESILQVHCNNYCKNGTQ